MLLAMIRSSGCATLLLRSTNLMTVQYHMIQGGLYLYGTPCQVYSVGSAPSRSQHGKLPETGPVIRTQQINVADPSKQTTPKRTYQPMYKAVATFIR